MSAVVKTIGATASPDELLKRSLGMWLVIAAMVYTYRKTRKTRRA